MQADEGDQLHPLIVEWRGHQRLRPDEPDGLESGAQDIATEFFQTFGRLSTDRLFLEAIYVMWMESGMPPLWIRQMRRRPFSQVLYAMARGKRYCSVLDGGSTIAWT